MDQNVSIQSSSQHPPENQGKKVSKTEKKSSPNLKPVRLRDFNPAISFYPLFFFTIIAALIEDFWGADLTGTPMSWLQIIWLAFFFVTICIAVFNFPTLKVIGLFLVIVVFIMVMILLYNNHFIEFSLGDIGVTLEHINFGFTTPFYVAMAGIFGIILLVVILSTRINYIKIEENEVLVKGIFGDVKRFPTLTLKYEKKIIDVFEYLLVGGGQLILNFPNELPIVLNCVPRIQAKAKRIDDILSYLNTSR